MNKPITRRAPEILNAAMVGRIPENVRAIAEDSVAKTRTAYTKINSVTKDGMKALEDIIDAANSGAKTIGEKLLRNTEVNVEAALDAAEDIARAKSLSEAATLQANFVRQQLTIVGTQTQEIFEISTRVAQQAFESMNSARTTAYENFHNTK
jgi:phasin